jgi:hypothetical protein
LWCQQKEKKLNFNETIIIEKKYLEALLRDDIIILRNIIMILKEIGRMNS